MKIFAAGLGTETNTFCPIETRLEDFTVLRAGDDSSGREAFASLDLSIIWGAPTRARQFSFLRGLNAWAQPSGKTTRSAFETLRDELLDDLRRAAPVDVVLLMLHGAMVADGYDDCERDILERVRALTGARTTIGVEFDLHCHLSEAKLAPADIALTYKEYPHSDINARAAELFDLAIAAQEGAIRPTMSLFDCRMVGMYPTSRSPLREFVEEMGQAEQRDGVLSVSFGHGFQFADVRTMGAKVLVVADDDADLAAQTAEELGLRVHSLRRDIGFDSISAPLEQALSRALESASGTVVVADQSDNPGGGAPGDATFALRWLLERDAQNVALAFMYDPEVVKVAIEAGIDARVRVRLGGKLEPASGAPIDLDVEVFAVARNHAHGLVQSDGGKWAFPIGDAVAIRHKGIEIVVTSERCQCFDPSAFSDLGIDPRRRRVLVVKSYQHFYDAFASFAGDIIYMAGPGAVPPDPRQLHYAQFDPRGKYPWSEHPFQDAL